MTPSAISMSASTPFLPFLTLPRRRPSPLVPRASSQEDSNTDRKRCPGPPADLIDVLKLCPATLTVLSASLSVAAPAQAEPRKRASRRASAPASVEEIQRWHRNLPALEIDRRIPYTDLLRLREDRKLKNIVKHPTTDLKSGFNNAVLVVLDDSSVLRTVLPPVKRDPKFWRAWQSLRMDDLCVNAYTPSLKRPQIPLEFLGNLFTYLGVALYGVFAPLVAVLAPLGLTLGNLVVMPLPLPPTETSQNLQELEMAQAKLVAMRREMTEKEVWEKLGTELILRKKMRSAGRTRRKMDKVARKAEFESFVTRKSDEILKDDRKWFDLSANTDVTSGIGLVMFFVFYWLVVYRYKRDRKDYEDRMKIEKAEREERKKIRDMELEMAGLAGLREEELENDAVNKNVYMKMAKKFMQSGARVRRVHVKQLAQSKDQEYDVKFSDCAGLGKIRFELEEIVRFFTHGDVYRRRGVKIPGGILLCGPPGVGKTLLAKAVAGEAGVNFFSISASQFVEIYVGVGAARVRALYDEAKENAPSVVFIDELDAVGRERGLIKGSGGQERDATLNQLLVCLDGFEGRGNVVTIAATNRPDILDPALVRPGRFDRKIFIPTPGLIGRAEILQVHARKKKMAEDVDYEAVASMTEGMVGAELANIIEIAAINIKRDGRSEITTDDLLQAAQAEEIGFLNRRQRSLDTWKRLALNQAALAVVATSFSDLRNVEFITISPRAEMELGYVRFKLDDVKFDAGMVSRQTFLDYITMQLAPRAADEIWSGEDKMSTIWARTADNARTAARGIVIGGLSEKHHGLWDFWAADRIDDIDVQAARILDACYTRAKEILQRNRVLVDAVVDDLAEKKSLTKKEFFGLVNKHGNFETSPPTIMDIRKDKLAKFRETLMSKSEAHGSNAR